MGDMGDVFRDLRAHNQERRSAKAEAFLASDLYLSDRFVRHTDTHFSTRSHGKSVDYWPSTGKWQYDKKAVQQGSLARFADWLARQDALPPARPERSRRHQG